MANNCLYEMRIHGDHDAAMELADNVINMGRIYNADVQEVSNFPESAEILVWGDCKWSLEDALGLEYEPDSEFRKEVARLGLSVEAYGSEPAMGLQEHYVFRKGELAIAQKTTDYTEYFFGEDDDELADEIAAELGVPKAMLPLMASPDQEFTIAIDGYKWDFAMDYAKAGPTLDELKADAFLAYADMNSDKPGLEPASWDSPTYAWNPVERSVVSVRCSDSEDAWYWERYKVDDDGTWECVDEDRWSFEMADNGDITEGFGSSQEAFEDVAGHEDDVFCSPAVFEMAKKAFETQGRSDSVRGMLIPVHGKPTEVEIPREKSYERMSSELGGNIECLNLPGDIDLWVNDEGLINGMPLNRAVWADFTMEKAGYISQFDYSTTVKEGDLYTVLAGPILALGVDAEGDIASLSDKQVADVVNRFDDVYSGSKAHVLMIHNKEAGIQAIPTRNEAERFWGLLHESMFGSLDSKREEIKELRKAKSSVVEPSDAEHLPSSRNGIGKDEI